MRLFMNKTKHFAVALGSRLQSRLWWCLTLQKASWNTDTLLKHSVTNTQVEAEPYHDDNVGNCCPFQKIGHDAGLRKAYTYGTQRVTDLHVVHDFCQDPKLIPRAPWQSLQVKRSIAGVCYEGDRRQWLTMSLNIHYRFIIWPSTCKYGSKQHWSMHAQLIEEKGNMSEFDCRRIFTRGLQLMDISQRPIKSLCW